jgi:hypothetical protein
MTRVRFFSALVGSALVMVLAGNSAPAAPIPKGAGTGEVTPDLKVFFETADKAVKAEKWPAEDDEKVLRWTAEKVFARVLKAAEQKDRKLPVEFDKLAKLPVAANYMGKLDNQYLVTGTAKITIAQNSVIFASGHVQITTARHCVIVAPSVKVTGFDNCVIIAGDHFRATSARQRPDAERSVVVAGQWIRISTLTGTVCHVLRPGKEPAPDEKVAGPQPAITANTTKDAIFLNDRGDTRGTDPEKQLYLAPKTPIAK